MGAEKTLTTIAEDTPKAIAAVGESADTVGKMTKETFDAIESAYDNYQKAKKAEAAFKAKKTKKCPNPGGRKGSQAVRDQNKQIARDNEAAGAKHTAGADLPEQYYPNPNGLKEGGRYSDVENTFPDGTKIVTQTVDHVNGIPTPNEIDAALDILDRLEEGDSLVLVPKNK